MKIDTIIDGVELTQVGEPAISLIGTTIDRREHFFYADQNYDEARQLMDDLNLDLLPLVDRNLKVVAVLDRTAPDSLPPFHPFAAAHAARLAR